MAEVTLISQFGFCFGFWQPRIYLIKMEKLKFKHLVSCSLLQASQIKQEVKELTLRRARKFRMDSSLTWKKSSPCLELHKVLPSGLNHPNSLVRDDLLFLFCTEKTEAQRRKVTYAQSHMLARGIAGILSEVCLNLGFPASIPHASKQSDETGIYYTSDSKRLAQGYMDSKFNTRR